MKIKFNKLLVFFFVLIAAKQNSFAQVTVPNYTACPNQVIFGTATWNNVSSITYSLYAPPVGGPPVWIGPPTIFTLNPGPAAVPPAIAAPVYTLVGIGNGLSGTVTSTALFTVSIIPPPPLTLSQASNFYCNGSTITINAQLGGSVYTATGSNINVSSTSNVITIFPAAPNMGPIVTVMSVINGCTVTGNTNVQVSPYKTLAVSSATNVCQGGCVTLTANLPGGTHYQWYDAANSPILTDGGNSDTYNPCNLTVNNAQTYKIMADDQFNGLLCPYSNTVQLNVVQTSPLVAAASPSNVVCQGTNINLSATYSVNPSSWLWTGPSFNSSAPTPIITSANPVNSGIYSVTALFQGGFLTCSTSATIDVSVIPIAVPVISMPASVCQDQTFTLSGTSALSNTVSFNWSGPLFSGGVCSTCNGVFSVDSAHVNASGTQFLTVKYSLPGKALQCAVTTSAQLNVVPVNTVSVIPPGIICSPTNAFLQALATGASQYQWTGPNYSAQGPNVWVYYPTPANNGIYTVTAYFTSGNLTCSKANTLELTVYPVMHFSLIPRQQLCYNSAVTISGPAGASSYSWTSSTGFVSSNKDISFASVQPNNTGTYTLNVSLGPCQSSSSSELVVLTPLAFTLTPFDRTICRGDTIFLEGGATGGSENYAFVWNPPVYLESSTGPKQMAVPLGSVLYNLIVHDIACPNYTIAQAFNVKVNQPPIPDLQLNVGEGCSPLCLLMDSKISKSAINTYDFGGRLVFQHDSTKFTYCLDEPGTYTLKIHTKGFNGCSNTFEYPYPLIVNPSPGADIYWNPEIPTTNDEITFYPTYKSDYPIIYHSWSFLGGITEGDTTMNNSPGISDTTNVKNPKRKYAQYGEYPVVLIAQNDRGCTDTIYKLVKVIDEMQLYIPNSFTPNDDGINDLFMAKGTGIKLESFTMDIFTRAGTNVFTTKDINQGWDGRLGGQVMKDATYIYKIRAVGMNGEGRREFIGYFTLIK